MLNEGILANSTKTLVKSEMVRQLQRLGSTTPKDFERVVFESLVGHKHSEVDWSIDDNHAGYYTWVKTFDQLVGELIEDGYVVEKEAIEGGKTLIANEIDAPIDYSYAVYPSR